MFCDAMYCKKVETPGAEDPFAFKLPETTYMGHELPTRSLYDAIGWILSITAVLFGINPDQNNFCLPLLGLFGRWCSVLLPVELLPAMLHISYWTSGNRLHIILGSTPGRDQVIWSHDHNVWHKGLLEFIPGKPLDMPTLPPGHFSTDENGLMCITKIEDISHYDTSQWSKTKDKDTYWGVRGWDIIDCRQRTFKNYGGVLNEPIKHLIDERGQYEADSGFGRCAETFIYLWMLQQR